MRHLSSSISISIKTQRQHFDRKFFFGDTPLASIRGTFRKEVFSCRDYRIGDDRIGLLRPYRSPVQVSSAPPVFLPIKNILFFCQKR